MELQTIALLAALGCCTGFLAGLLGIGGGMIMTPFLIMLIPASLIPQDHIVHVAIATSLATITFTSLSSVRAHHKRGAVLWNVVASVAPGILLGALLGAQIASLLSTFWISLIFSCFVGFSAFKMFMNKRPKADRELPGNIGRIFVGTIIGILSALVGAGGGFISVPWMIWCNVKMHNAVATSAALGFPIALFGTMGYIISGWNVQGLPQWPVDIGYICIPALFALAIPSVLFAPLGAKVAHSIDVKPLKKCFACLLCCLCVYMLRQAYLAW
ncbi:sulfite exporter TauE/SafE family protein [uncultured Turicimonas sp.]|uniref:sulfite exporter TauE/SafE family protein n=1 Tax=uncultured Turicimonas sp. TaxID=1918607 RepID=UPI002805BD50|nr:sulfite exporter TauE/SafE family protein [uncultured Turicimonas sp.]